MKAPLDGRQVGRSAGRQVGILIADGSYKTEIDAMRAGVEEAGGKTDG